MRAERKREIIRKALALAPEGGYEAKSRAGLALAPFRIAQGQPIDEAQLAGALWHLYYRLDCGDFAVAALLRTLYLCGERPLIPNSLREELAAVLLDFDYWYTERSVFPGKQNTWTENHIACFRADEYLAAQYLPNGHFRAREASGACVMARVKPLLLDWMDQRLRVGFSEWYSSTYMAVNVGTLLNLYDFARDGEIHAASKRLLDVIFLELALMSHEGAYGPTQGRAYSDSLKHTAQESVAPLSYIMWGDGTPRAHMTASGVVALATSAYECPSMVDEIYARRKEPLTTLAQQSFDVEDASLFGKQYTREEDMAFFCQNMGYAHWAIIDTMMAMNRRYGICVHDEVYPISRGFHALRGKGKTPEIPCPCITYMPRVNVYTVRCAEYMLGCAQDFRKGEQGFQQHIWSAMLGGEAKVFVSSPGNLLERQGRPDLWGGNQRMPRAAQHGVQLICLYDVRENEDLKWTHAYFPKECFEAVRTQGHWTFGKRGEGYVALYSQHLAEWSQRPGYEGCELVCPAPVNAWLCVVGDRKGYGSFEGFMEAVAISEILHGENQSVTWFMAGMPRLRFAWDGPLIADGEVQSLRDYPRLQNSYVTSVYGSGLYTLRVDEREENWDGRVVKRPLLDE